MVGESAPFANGSSPQELTDHELCDIIRGGEAWPLDLLWRRHSGEARAWASKKDLSAAEDVVAESFALVFQALLGGGGPSESFRGYLYRTMDSVFVKHWGAQRRTSPLDDLEALRAEDAGALSDALEDEQEQEAAAAALTELPERWRQAIVAVDVEGRPVHEVARDLELSPNSASVLLKRARQGLRKAWMQNLHRPSPSLAEECAHAVQHFGVLRWGKKGTRRRSETERHLEGCGSCRTRYAQFVGRASSVGLGLAGLIALTRDWREKLIPSLATTAAVAASFTVTVTLVPPLPAPPLPDSSELGELPESGSGGELAEDPGPRDSRSDADRGDAEPADPASGEPGVHEPPVESSEEDPATRPDDSPSHLYFGDWTGWDEERGGFILEP